jgi:hypothetical protein
MGQPVKPLHPSRAEIACYAADMLASLRRLSEASGMSLLAHLVDLACVEALRNAHAGDGPGREASDGRRNGRRPAEPGSH